jgi:hypothetical protein
MNAEVIKSKIADTVIDWYWLKSEATKLKKERGSFVCKCDADDYCYVMWINEQITLEEMLECEVAKHYYELSKPYRTMARRAAGEKNRLNGLIKQYNL